MRGHSARSASVRRPDLPSVRRPDLQVRRPPSRALIGTGVLLFSLLVPSPAAAQLQPPPPLRPPAPLTPMPLAGPVLPKFFVTGGAGVQLNSSDFRHEVQFDLFREVAQIGGPMEIGRPPRFMAGVGFRLHRRMGVGLAVGGVRTTGRMEATFFLPNPFAFADARVATATATTERRTLDTHLQFLLLLNHGEDWKVTLHTGPTFSRVSQSLATDRFAYEFAFPFTEVVLTPVDRSATSAMGVGGHVGLSFARRLSNALAVDTTFLWHTAVPRLEMRDADGGTLQPIQAGGLQVVFGLRYSR